MKLEFAEKNRVTERHRRLAVMGESVSGADAEVNNMTLGEMERALIYKTLDGVEWNRTQAAGILGTSVRILRNKRMQV